MAAISSFLLSQRAVKVTNMKHVSGKENFVGETFLILHILNYIGQKCRRDIFMPFFKTCTLFRGGVTIY